jgi:hypothetical protein
MRSMSTKSSVRVAARMVVGLDLGTTTFSGFAFAHMSNPDHVYTFYDWPIQVKGGGRPYCKQNNRCSLLQIAVVSHKYGECAVDELRAASLPWKHGDGLLAFGSQMTFLPSNETREG